MGKIKDFYNNHRLGCNIVGGIIIAASSITIGFVAGVAVSDMHKDDDPEIINYEEESDRDRHYRTIEFAKTLALEEGDIFVIARKSEEEYAKDKEYWQEVFEDDCPINKVTFFSAGDD